MHCKNNQNGMEISAPSFVKSQALLYNSVYNSLRKLGLTFKELSDIMEVETEHPFYSYLELKEVSRPEPDHMDDSRGRLPGGKRLPAAGL